MVRYLVIDRESTFNIIIGRVALNHWGAVPSSVHQCVKFSIRSGRIGVTHGNLLQARRCYNNSMNINAQRRLDMQDDEQERQANERERKWVPPPPPTC
mgnify:CR=1 FL=1